MLTRRMEREFEDKTVLVTGGAGFFGVVDMRCADKCECVRHLHRQLPYWLEIKSLASFYQREFSIKNKRGV
ncbi:MAG: hypothetical protein WA977_00540 [Halobacteriota archaeon]